MLVYQTGGTILVKPHRNLFPVWIGEIKPEDVRLIPTGIVILRPEKYRHIVPVGNELADLSRQIRMF